MESNQENLAIIMKFQSLHLNAELVTELPSATKWKA